MPPKKRIKFSDEHKRKVRLFYNTVPDGGSRPSQQDVVNFAKTVLYIDIDQPQVSKWTSRRYASLETTIVPSHGYRQRLRPYETLEHALFEWMQQMETRITLTGSLIMYQADRFYHRLPYYSSEEWLQQKATVGFTEPKWSPGWLGNFKATYGIAKHKRHGELASAKAINCDEEIEAIQRQLLAYALCDIYNCDKTGLFFKAIPDVSLTTKPTPGQKIKKDRITAIHTCSADGERLKIWFIGKAKSPRCFKNIKLAAMAWYWRNNKKAWMNTAIMIEYLLWFDKQVAGRQVDALTLTY